MKLEYRIISRSLQILFLMAVPLAACFGETLLPVRNDFNSAKRLKNEWRVYGMLMVPETEFSIRRRPNTDDNSVLRIEARYATGVLATKAFTVNPKKYPRIRWRWRVNVGIDLKPGEKEPDDQAVVLYIGDEMMTRRFAIGYSWEKNTPVNTIRRKLYQGGLFDVRAVCLRNDSWKKGVWVVEEREYAKDFKEQFGRELSGDFVLSIGANSQRSNSHTVAEIDYIEFLPAEKNAK